jgi:class I fructose-bisphosphate aldolase
MHLNIGNDLEDRMLADLGALTDEAHLLGLPVMAVLYAVGGQIVQELDPSLVAHCIRLGGELGVDLIGVPYSGDAESFGAAAAASPAPVVIVGGQSRPDFDSFLGMAAEALDAGAAGVAVGRNIFQNPDPLARLDQLAALVHSAGPSGEDREEPQPGPDPAEARQDA